MDRSRGRSRVVIGLVIACVSAAGPVALAQPDNERPRERGRDANRQERGGGGRFGNPMGGLAGTGGGLMNLFGVMGGGGFGGGTARLPVSSDDVAIYAEMLKFSPEQMTAVEALHAGFEETFRAESEKMRDRMQQLREDMRETRDPSMWQSMADVVAAARAKRAELEASFLNDVKAVLNEQQAGEWVSVERLRRREQGVQRSLMSGERIDLTRVVEGLGLSGESMAAAKVLIEQYQGDLDRELIERAKVQDEAADKFRQLLTAQDYDQMQKLFERGRASAMKVRDVNLRYARQISAALPEDKREAFETTIKRQSFPLIHRPTYAGRALEGASKFEDLSAEQKTALGSIRDSYEQQMSGLNTRMEAAFAKREETWNPVDAMKAEGGQGFGQLGAALRSFETEELRTLREQRQTLESATIDKIMGVLTPEQAALLPEREGRLRGGENDARERRRDRRGAGEDRGEAASPRL